VKEAQFAKHPVSVQARQPVNRSYLHVRPPRACAPLSVLPTAIQIGEVPLIVGLALSALMTALAALLFRTRVPALDKIKHAGVLELAWLFSRTSADHAPLVSVDVPTDTALRTAGERVRWRGAVEERFEMDEHEGKASAPDL
jgi:hypothetical protein